MAKTADFNWRGLARISFLVAFAMLIWITWPANKCAFDGMDSASALTGESQDQVDRAGAGYESRISGSASFWSRFTSSIGPCYERYGISQARPWQRYLFYGSGALFITAFIAARVLSPRYRMG